MKEIAIIIPAYNAENTISNTIESILNQTYSNYELIIIDDHSKDNTQLISKEYESKYRDKIKYFSNLEGKKGVSSARNYGISKSNSKYIMFLDSDDSYEKEMLSNMLKEIQENDLVVCGYRKTGKNKDDEIHCFSEEISVKDIIGIKNTIEDLQKADLFNESCNKIFKSEIIKKYNIRFPEDISLGEDYRFVLDYIERCKKIKVINRVLYVYNRSESGLALRYNKNNLRTRLDNLIYHKNFYNRNNLDTNYLDKLYILSFFSGFAEIVRNNNKKQAKEIIRSYIYDEKINQQLNVIKNNKLKIFKIILNVKSVNINYFLGKTYNVLKKICKRT